MSYESRHTFQSLNLGFYRDNRLKRGDPQLEAGPGQSLDEQLHGLIEGQFVVDNPQVIIVEKWWLPLIGHVCREGRLFRKRLG